MLDVRELCTKLTHYHWSPKLPQSYVLDSGKGLGTIAANCYGTFNLIWATHKLESTNDHLAAITAFTVQRPKSEQIIRGAPLHDWLTLLNAHEFSYWYAKNGGKVNHESKVLIDKALLNLSNKAM